MAAFLIESLFLTKGKEGAYNQAQEDIKTLIALIDEKVGAAERKIEMSLYQVIGNRLRGGFGE